MRKIILILFSLLFLFLSCAEKKSSQNNIPDEPVLLEKIFPIPYLPEKKISLLGLPLSAFSNDWKVACIYSKELMNSKQSSFIKSLKPMQDEGEWGTTFSKDFDGDKYIETVNYGAFQKKNGNVGNFLLITRKIGNEINIVVLHEYIEEGGRFACFYLINKDQSIMYGTRLIGSELSSVIKWGKNGPSVYDTLQGEY